MRARPKHIVIVRNSGVICRTSSKILLVLLGHHLDFRYLNSDRYSYFYYLDREPKSNRGYWVLKIEVNKKRDAEYMRMLELEEWHSHVDG